MRIVVDASMALSWLLNDEGGVAAERVLSRVVEEGAQVPVLWPLEVANALNQAMRRGRCSESHVDLSLERLADLAIDVDPDTNVHAWGSTLALARDEGLTTYDAAYLELAIRHRVPLATCDRRLAGAASRRGVETLPG